MEGILIKSLRYFFSILIVFLLLGSNVRALDVSASSAVVINGDTLEVIYSKYPFQKRSMASTTKIMTALLLCESGRLDETIVCSASAVQVEGSSLGLKAGDRISGRDLLFGIMLVSGNDAANVCADFLGGSEDEFIKMMNRRASELGLKNTNFETPSGLDSDNHYTTAYDLAVLTAHALKNDEFKNACSSASAHIAFGNPPIKREIKNHNRLLTSFDGCVGVKTGFTKKSGRCLVSAVQKDDRSVIVVTLNDPNDWKDHTELLGFGLDNLEKFVYNSDDFADGYVSVIGSSKKSISYDFDDLSTSFLPENGSKGRLALSVPKYLFAPVEKGDKIGTVSLVFEDRVLAKTDVYATAEAPKTEHEELNFFEKIKKIFLLTISVF